MVIPSAIGASQPGQSRVKPLLCSHQRGQGIHSNLPERERERERRDEGEDGSWWEKGGQRGRGAVIYSLYHGEFYGSDLWFCGEFYGLTKDGQLQFKSRAVSSLPEVCVCAPVFVRPLPFEPTLPFFTLKAYFIILTAYCLSILPCTSWFMCCRCLPLKDAFLIECFSARGAEAKQ